MKKRRGSKRFLKAVGARFRSLRKKQKKEIDNVAKAIGISSRLLQRIEDGEYDMYVDMFFELCDYYDVATHDFIKAVEQGLKK